ncbi:MAG: hypothetical protein C4293_09540 [Nitrospiraceae bacterium]
MKRIHLLMPSLLFNTAAFNVAVATALVWGEPPESIEQQTNIVSGILEELDLSRMKGKIKTDLGEPVFFGVPKPELFQGLTVGERITIQVDDQGGAVKVIDTPVPELRKPLK